ncbi:MAG TPA: hypothetical protein VLD61_11895 [Methylomirabilota bacterium]|nr:hypothetical protein [Methylomirabilota bacterium]
MTDDRSRTRTNQARILEHLRVAARRGDRAALALALDEMRTLAFTPRYWLKYLTLLQHPLARLVDLLVIKQGDRIAQQKGWTGTPRRRAKPTRPEGAKPPRRRKVTPRRRAADQPTLFPGL